MNRNSRIRKAYMKCPRCGEINQKDDKSCNKCGLRLKINCPKCKSLNPIGQEKCSNCNLRLITFCPDCRTPNHPSATNCKKCNQNLVKECHSCRTPNQANRSFCIKCGKTLEKSGQQKSIEHRKPSVSPDETSTKNKAQKPAETPQGLENYAVLSIELINFSVIAKKIKQEDILLRLQNKFYHTVAVEAKNRAGVARKLSDQVMSVEFKSAKSTKISAVQAINTAQQILEVLNEFNFQIYKKIKIKLKVKIGISIINFKNKNYFSQIERSVATAGDIVISANVYNLVHDYFEFETVGPLSVENEMITLYKLKDVIEEEKINNDALKAAKPEQPVNNENLAQTEAKTEADQIPPDNKNASKEETSDSSEKAAQSDIANVLTNALIKSKEGLLVGLSGADGIGKSTTSLSVRQNLADEQIVWLIGQCHSFSKIIPYAFFQDLLRSLFNLPSFNINVDESKKAINQALEAIGIKNKQAENVICKLLFYEFAYNNYDLAQNKQEILDFLLILFGALYSKGQIILIIEDFEYIDNASLEGIKYLLSKGLLGQKNHIIINYSSDENLNRQFSSCNINHKIFNLKLNPMNQQDINSMVLGMLNNQPIIPEYVMKQIYRNAKGLPIYVEQALWLLFQSGAIINNNGELSFNPDFSNFNLPVNIQDIFKIRLTQLNKITPDILKVLSCASILGQKFVPAIVRMIAEIDEQKFNNVLQVLQSNGIFIQLDNFNLMFKHKLLWDIVYHQIPEEEKISCHNRTLQILLNYTNSGGSVLALHAEFAQLNQEALIYWNQAVQQAIAVGDVQLYTISQQEILNVIDYVDLPEKEDLKLSIYEQVGKINYEIDPAEAIKYLSTAIYEREKKNHIVQMIDLTGYLARSCDLTGNYTGVIECADKALVLISKKEMPIEFALLVYSKLEAIYNLGQFEEAITLARTEIIPTIEENVIKNQTIPGLDIKNLNYIKFEAELILSKALSAQGNKEASIVSNALALRAGELGYTDIEIQAKLADAFIKILQGDMKSVNAIFEYINNIISKSKDPNYIKLYCDFLNLVTNLLNGKFEEAENAIYPVLELAEYYKDFNLQLIIKFFIGKLFKETKNFEQAKTIYKELINYCSEHKLATGALLGWYLVSELYLAEADLEQAQGIAERALEIAQKSHINNHLFSILLHRLLTEICTVKGDFESAQMHAEKGINIAEKMNLYLFMSYLYLSFGKIYHEFATASDNTNKAEFVSRAHEFYLKSLDIAQKIENEYVIIQIESELTDLATFCQLSGIKI